MGRVIGRLAFVDHVFDRQPAWQVTAKALPRFFVGSVWPVGPEPWTGGVNEAGPAIVYAFDAATIDSLVKLEGIVCVKPLCLL